MGPWGPPAPPAVNLLLSQWRKTVMVNDCVSSLDCGLRLRPRVSLPPQAASITVLLLQAVGSGGSRPSLSKQPARTSSAPPQPSKVEATPPSTASVFSACCGSWAATPQSSYWPAWVCNRTPGGATGLDPSVMVNYVGFRQQSQLDKRCREQPPVRALLGWAFFSGRGHFFITWVRKHSFLLRRSHFGPIQSGFKLNQYY